MTFVKKSLLPGILFSNPAQRFRRDPQIGRNHVLGYPADYLGVLIDKIQVFLLRRIADRSVYTMLGSNGIFLPYIHYHLMQGRDRLMQMIKIILLHQEHVGIFNSIDIQL